MSSNVNKLMNSITQSTDLLLSGHQLIEFANAVYKEKNRATLVKYFYEQLYQCSLSEYVFGESLNNKKSNYFICNESNAARMYIALAIPKETSTVKSINGIRTLGEFILSHFTKPIGECISETLLEDILQYLDTEYLFSSKVFSNEKAIFIRIHNSHTEYNSECLTLGNGKEIENHFFLYHMKEKNSSNPVVVLFHELGHALHAQYSGDIRKVPVDMVNKLHDLCFPTIKQLDAATQSELFADVLGLGLMYQTPYDYDFYKEIHPNDKKEFKMIVKNILESL